MLLKIIVEFACACGNKRTFDQPLELLEEILLAEK
jgi:hypothetical protein